MDNNQDKTFSFLVENIILSGTPEAACKPRKMNRTGKGRGDVVIQAINSGVDFYLQKGGEPESLFAKLMLKIRQAVKRHKAEADLIKSEANLQSIITNTNDILAVYDPEVRLLVYNQAASEIYGSVLGVELYPGLCAIDLFPESMLDFWNTNNKRALAEESFPIEFKLPMPNGQERFFESSYNPIRKDGVVVGFSTFTRDITERRVAEQMLQKAHDNLEVTVKERTADLYSANMKLQKEIKHSNVIAESLKEYAKMTSILNEVIITANKAEMLHYLFRDSLDKALELLDFEAGEIYLLNPVERTAETVYTENLPDDFIEITRKIPIDASPYDTLFIREQPIITEHFEELSPELAENYHFCSLASIPLISKHMVIGALNVISAKRYTISIDEIRVLTAIGRELGTSIARMIDEDEAKKVSVNLQTLFASINEMIFVLDIQGQILSVNDAVLKRLQYTPGELEGTDVVRLHVPERRDEALHIAQGMIAGTIDSCPVPLLSKDGTRIEVETKVTSGWWNGSKVLIGVSRDVTERKRAEEALRELTDRLTLATRVGGVGIWDYDVVNNILTWDDQMFALYGITREQFGGAYEAWQTGVNPDDQQRGDEEIQMAIRGEKEFDTEFRVLWPDGSTRNIRAIAHVQRDAGGNTLRMIGTNWDITQQRQTC